MRFLGCRGIQANVFLVVNTFWDRSNFPFVDVFPLYIRPSHCILFFYFYILEILKKKKTYVHLAITDCIKSRVNYQDLLVVDK